MISFIRSGVTNTVSGRSPRCRLYFFSCILGTLVSHGSRPRDGSPCQACDPPYPIAEIYRGSPSLATLDQTGADGNEHQLAVPCPPLGTLSSALKFDLETGGARGRGEIIREHKMGHACDRRSSLARAFFFSQSV